MSDAQRKLLAEMTRTAAADGHYDTPEDFVDTRPDLITWLREQIAEDAAKARAATAGPWVKDAGSGYVHGGQDCRFVIAAQVPPWNSAHITRHDPRAVLAQCEAHTRIIDEVVPRIDEMDDKIEQEWGSSETGPHEESELILKLLALAYQHRPGYQEEWRPTSC